MVLPDPDIPTTKIRRTASSVDKSARAGCNQCAWSLPVAPVFWNDARALGDQLHAVLAPDPGGRSGPRSDDQTIREVGDFRLAGRISDHLDSECIVVFEQVLRTLRLERNERRTERRCK